MGRGVVGLAEGDHHRLGLLDETGQDPLSVAPPDASRQDDGGFEQAGGPDPEARRRGELCLQDFRLRLSEQDGDDRRGVEDHTPSLP